MALCSGRAGTAQFTQFDPAPPDTASRYNLGGVLLTVPIAIQGPGFEIFTRAYSDGAQILVDAAALLKRLGYQVKREGSVIEAIDALQHFVLDFAAQQVRMADGTVAPMLNQLQFSVEDSLYLITVPGIQRVWDEDVVWDETRLALRLSSAATRFQTPALAPRRFLGGEAPGPLRYGLTRPIIGGGVVAWYAASQWQGRMPLWHQASADYTLSVLGGAVRGSVAVRGHNRHVRYTYGRPRGRWLTRVEAGTRIAHRAALAPGLRLSNVPLVLPQIQREGLIRGRVEPHAIVEVMAGGQITDRAQADGAGRYALRAPAYYGTTEVTVRVRPMGGLPAYERREFVLTTPALGLHRRLYYDVLASDSVAVARVQYGITPRLTAELYGGWAGAMYASVTASPAANLVLSANAGWPLRLSGLSAQFWRRGASASAAYSGLDNQQSFTASAAAQWRAWSASVSANASRAGGRRWTSRQVGPALSYHGRSGLSVRSQISLSDARGLRRLAWRHSVGYRRSAGRAALHIAAFARTHDHAWAGGSEVLISAGRGGMGITTEYAPSTRELLGWITIHWRTRAGSIRSRRSMAGEHMHTAQGAVSIGETIRFSDGVSESGEALFRLFEDLNRNRRQDPGEPLLDQANIQVWHAPTTRDKDGTLRATALQPYTNYQVTIDEESIQDPWLRPVPGYSWSFTADPGRTKVLRVPMQRVPLVRGGIVTDSYAFGILRVVVRREEHTAPLHRLPVYRDGGFAVRLDAGSYRLSVENVVDGAQLTSHAIAVAAADQVVEITITID